jgi:hypothetical protein
VVATGALPSYNRRSNVEIQRDYRIDAAEWEIRLEADREEARQVFLPRGRGVCGVVLFNYLLAIVQCFASALSSSAVELTILAVFSES